MALYRIEASGSLEAENDDDARSKLDAIARALADGDGDLGHDWQLEVSRGDASGEVNIVRVHLSSGTSLDVDSAFMLDNGELDTDSFDAIGEGATAIRRRIRAGRGVHVVDGDQRTYVVIEGRAVLALEEREQA